MNESQRRVGLGSPVDSDHEMSSTLDFVDFYTQIHQHEPYPWQARLADEVIKEGRFPRVINLPTGSGKTAIVDVAIFALAMRPDLFARRIVFVIDRRIVVDQVFDRVGRIANAIRTGDSSLLVEIRTRLNKLSDASDPIGYVSLRGGTHIDGEWAHRIDQPWVIVSTVDHFGSRLLFRGYGVSKRMRPIHAGLTGNDCLVILDEVHLSVPFRDTLNGIEEYQAKSARYLPQRFQVVEMSATTPETDAGAFTLQPSDLADAPVLRQRMYASKTAELVSVGKRSDVAKKVSRLLNELRKSLDEAAKLDKPPCFTAGVIVNRVKTAQEIKEASIELGIECYLIIGRMRPIDKAKAVRELSPFVATEQKEDETGFRVVVATQAIEVGANFDFDHLITECAPIDCLRQRFGRLDRQGTRSARTSEPTTASIIGIKNELRERDTDPIYGDATKNTWSYLQTQVASAAPLEFGPLQHLESPSECLSESKNSPLLLPTYMEAWAQTNPDPGVQPNVDWFLHGIDTEQQIEPEVSIVWRWDRSTEALTAVPIRQAESLDLPISAIKAWLGSNEAVRTTLAAEINDVHISEDRPRYQFSEDRKVQRWRRDVQENHVETVQLSELRPGDTVLASPDQGGLSDGVWMPTSDTPVLDLGDLAQLEYGKCATLRLDDRVLGSGEHPPSPADEVESIEPLSVRVRHWLENYEAHSDADSSYREIASRLLDQGFAISTISASTDEGDEQVPSYYVLREIGRNTKSAKFDMSYMDDAGESGSMTGSAVTLRSHLKGVAAIAERTAQRLGFNETLANDLKIAAALHDIGKVDERFQLKLVGGDEIRHAGLREPLAKSIPNCKKTDVYPKGMRHEVASMALVTSNMKVLANAHDKDLVLHLIGSHHGWCRPLPFIAKDENPVLIRYKVDENVLIASSDQVNHDIALDSAHRFWLLVERYGYYGLAWLESVVRLSDHLRSNEESG